MPLPRLRSLIAIILPASMALCGCSPPRVEDPLATLNTPSVTGTQHKRALQMLDEQAPNEPATLDLLEAVVTRSGYTVEVREEALNRLAERDLPRLKTAIRRTLPQTTAWAWITRVSEIIAQRGWSDLSPALVSSWSRPTVFVRNELERPEYLALAKLHGQDKVVDLVFDMFVESRSVAEHGLRTRCWNLLHRLGQRDRLIALLTQAQAPPDDAMLIDLQAGARDLGLVPENREEILWLRELQKPERGEFYKQAVEAVGRLSPQRRAELEMRDLPIVVSASLHDPELLTRSHEDLYAELESYLKSQKRHVQDSNYEGFADNTRQRLHEYKGKLTWGDLAAMHIAVRALRVPEVVAHVFDYAERDRVDESTEYGGVIALDERNRFEVREFAPVVRHHDQKFIASQAMFDAAYTSIFHFHNHAQNYRNDKYAGPGFGDVNYADNTRANCLVFTFLGKDVMNVDYYRHGRVVIDLGEIVRR